MVSRDMEEKNKEEEEEEEMETQISRMFLIMCLISWTPSLDWRSAAIYKSRSLKTFFYCGLFLQKQTPIFSEQTYSPLKDEPPLPFLAPILLGRLEK